MNPRADQRTDALYADLRGRYGGARAGANGYRTDGFFRREQRVVLTALAEAPDGPVLDIACGSGLMLAPLDADPAGPRVVGLDYNAAACADAAANGRTVVRGDAFAAPFAAARFAATVNCQFLNQQTPQAAPAVLAETARMLRPGGVAVILWRNADSWLHRTAHGLLTALDRLRRRAVFPQHRHPLADMRAAADRAGLATLRAGVTLPLTLWPGRRPPVVGPGAALGRVLGASNLLVLRKPPESAPGRDRGDAS